MITGRTIDQQRLTVVVNFPGEKDGSPREYPFECISKLEIEPYLGSQQGLQWRFDMARGALIGENGKKVIAKVGPCLSSDPPAAVVATSPRQQHGAGRPGFDFPSLISAAQAAAPTDIAGYLDGLESASTVARREARDSLAIR